MSSETQELNQSLRQILENQGDIKERIARVETKQEGFTDKLDAFYENNDKAHNDMVSLITNKTKDVESRVQSLETGHSTQQTVIDRSMGIWDFVKWGIGIIVTLSTGAIAMKLFESL